jgi:FMN hydrolase / 5-amino-6-(5-phospho-D-ribitylamino)uracil phosphatase
MPALKAVTLDAYGTLFDFEGELRTRAVRDILEIAGASQHCPQAFAEAWGVQFFARYEQFGRDAGEGPEFMTIADITADALTATFREHEVEADPVAGTELWLERLAGVRVFEEIPAMLDALSGCLRLAVVSDIDDRVIEPALARLGWDFEFVLTSEGERSYKHHPGALIFHSAAERFGLQNAEIVHVGDSPADVYGARRAGFRAVWVNRYGRELPADCPRPDWEVTDLASLAELLRSAA